MIFQEDAALVSEALERYSQQSQQGDVQVINQQGLAALIQQFDLDAHVRKGDLTGQRLKAFLDDYLAAATRLHHPAYLAHQVSVPHYAGALASLVDGFTNNPMAIYEMGPGAAAIEYFMVNWLLGKVGWQAMPSDPSRPGEVGVGAGVLTHGGSLANTTALIAARSRLVPDVWQRGNPPDLALLAPAESHYSIARAAGILGIGRDALYPLAVNEQGVILPERLPQVLQRLQADGKRPLALVANACSTALGLYDPLLEVGRFCREEGIWFHVDGAHGASALLSVRYRHLLRGVELADSLVWDAHKLMRTPTVCAALLVREARFLDDAFEQEASYLFHDKAQPGFDFIRRTVECTKAALGLRIFMVLAALGEKGIADYIDRQYDLTREIHAHLQRQPDFRCAAPPQSNILCFRIGGEDKLQLQIRDHLMAKGDFYLSTALVNNRRYLRIVVMNPQTDLIHIEALLQEIRGIRKKIEGR